MSDLFASDGSADGAGGADDRRPLADLMRPRSLAEVVGQDHVLAPDAPLGAMLRSGRLSSLILWGPPGVGKTTIAQLLAEETDLDFVQISAIFTGVADLKRIFREAEARRQAGRGTLLFVDEIHRFNRAQQDGFLPHMEDGTIVLVGATTENPSFELNAALLSRAQVMVLKRLDAAALEELLARVETRFGSLPLTEGARALLVEMADGDGRALFNLAEQVLAASPEGPLDEAGLARLVTRRAPVYDKSGEEHYNLISALHKSIRASDPDAALYWLARMLAGGEDPRYIARRLTRMAIEDVGLADPEAQNVCLAAWQSYERLGSPEGDLALAEAALYLALAPKSNAAYAAWKKALGAARQTGSLMPALHSVNAPTKLMKALGYGRGYAYDHDDPAGISGQDHFPPGMKRRRFYEPVERGFERELKKRRDWFDRKRHEARARAAAAAKKENDDA